MDNDIFIDERKKKIEIMHKVYEWGLGENTFFKNNA